MYYLCGVMKVHEKWKKHSNYQFLWGSRQVCVIIEPGQHQWSIYIPRSFNKAPEQGQLRNNPILVILGLHKSI